MYGKGYTQFTCSRMTCSFANLHREVYIKKIYIPVIMKKKIIYICTPMIFTDMFFFPVKQSLLNKMLIRLSVWLSKIELGWQLNRTDWIWRFQLCYQAEWKPGKIECIDCCFWIVKIAISTNKQFVLLLKTAVSFKKNKILKSNFNSQFCQLKKKKEVLEMKMNKEQLLDLRSFTSP